ncbi:hypothetical protein TSUD_01150 [Trifolium subterraneum]|nr:hypothetical protein TSUD_01150 [Trifolium subterraneum]
MEHSTLAIEVSHDEIPVLGGTDGSTGINSSSSTVSTSSTNGGNGGGEVAGNDAGGVAENEGGGGVGNGGNVVIFSVKKTWLDLEIDVMMKYVTEPIDKGTIEKIKVELREAFISKHRVPIERSDQAIKKKYDDLKKNQKPLREIVNKMEQEKLDLEKRKLQLKLLQYSSFPVKMVFFVLDNEKLEKGLLFEELLEELEIVKDENEEHQLQLKLEISEDKMKRMRQIVYEVLEDKRDGFFLTGKELY